MERKVGVAFVALAAALAPSRASAQTSGSVTGQVVDRNTRQPVPDAQIFVAGTQRGTVTNQQGRFTINGVPAGAREIRVRRVGYGAATTTVTVAIGQAATADFVLATSATQLQEVTVNAVTGQQQTRVSTGTNTGYVNVDSLPKGPITQFSDVLQGKVAGVNLQSAAGSAGSSQRIRIRGANSLSLSNEPLIYIDGVLASNDKGGFATGGQDYSRLNDINFEDVENVEVLKGPAASAIYGSGAANGVVLITTRKGRAGRPRWGAYAETGPQKDVNSYPLNYAALTAYSGTTEPYYINDGGYLNTRAATGDAAAPYDICPNYRAAIPTGTTVRNQTSCAQNVFLSFDQFRDARTSPFQSGSISRGGINISGGSEALNYYLSGDKGREFGVLRPNDVDRTSLRTNLSARVGSNANVAITANYVTSATTRINNDNSIFSPLINAFLGPAQYIPGMESDTVSTPGNRYASYFGYNTSDQRKVTVGQGVDRFVLGATANYTPLSWLRLNGGAGLDNVNRVDAQTLDPSYNLPLAQSYILGFRQNTRAAQHLWRANGSATGTFNLLRDLVSTTTLGGEYQRDLYNSTYCYGVAIPSGLASCGATATQFAVDEEYTDVRTVSGFARQEFAYGDRVFVSGAVRTDNNSGLAGSAVFPQAQASWVVSKERFFPSALRLSLFRLRGAVGQAGLRPGYGTALTLYGNNAAVTGPNENSALTLGNTGNPNLKLERTTEAEGGFDASIGDRVTLEYTYFARRSKDALIARPLPPSAGLTAGPSAPVPGASTVYQNLGSITNKGQEFGLGATLLRTRVVTLASRLTATTLANKIVDLGFLDPVAGTRVPPIIFNRGAQAHREGYPAGSFFGAPITWNDANGDGKLNRTEVSIDSSRFLAGSGFAYLGPALPTHTQGLSFDLTVVKNLHFSTLFERRSGNKQLNYTSYFRCRTQNAAPFYGQCAALSDPNASLQEQAAYIASQFGEFGATPSGYIEDARFVKWRELSVRYDIPTSIARRVGVNNGLGFSVSGRNLKTWTKYGGLDPEINEGGGTSNFGQNEFNTQPPVRTITFRVDVHP